MFLFFSLESFNEAKSKAKKAEWTSDLSDTCSNSKGRRKLKTKKIDISQSSSALSDDDCPNYLSGTYIFYLILF